jgi:hypothetical protein
VADDDKDTPGPAKPIKLIAFGNLAVGFIAIGNVAVGVVAIGFAAAVGPIAIGLNSLGWLAAIGLNAVGTVSVAAINGLGVRTYAGTNGLGVFCDAGVNSGESIAMGVIAAVLQCAAAMLVGPRLRSPVPAELQEKPVRLADLVDGLLEEARLEITIQKVLPQRIDVSQEGCKASLTAPESVASDASALASMHSGRRAIVHVRASLEPLDAVPGTDYRKAPETRRVLVAESIEPAPTRPPWWSQRHTIARIGFASFLAGAVISAIAVVERLRMP